MSNDAPNSPSPHQTKKIGWQQSTEVSQRIPNFPKDRAIPPPGSPTANGTLEIIPSVAQFAGVQRSHIHQVKSGAPERHSGSETPISNPPPFGLLAQRHANHINQSSSIRFVPKASLNIEEDTTNLQELGMNLSGSQDKPTLALTIPRSNQVVYKGFPSATQFLSIQALPYSPLPDCTAFCTQAMIRTACAVYCQIQSRSRLHFVDLSSGASGLEAFSRYPTHDSFSAMPGRATEFTSHANQRFLSY